MFSVKKLREICLERTNNLVNNQDYLYIDNKAKVLAVAHADTVFKDEELFFLYEGRKNIVFSPGLDDRLGVYIVLEVLRGLDVDILVTTGEETMSSSANLFFPSKQYNWMVEFDRAGEDIVTYQYQWDNKLLKKYFPIIGVGSYSDIADLEHLKCLGLNIGIGYYSNHKINSFALLNETERAVNRFLKFFEDNKNKRFKFKINFFSVSKWKNWEREDYQKYWDFLSSKKDKKEFCPICGAEITEEERLTFVEYRMCFQCAFG